MVTSRGIRTKVSYLFSARHAVAERKEPFDARPPSRNTGFSQQVTPVICCKGARYRNRPILPRHVVHGQKPRGILYKEIRQNVTVQVVDEPAVRGITVHPADKTNHIRVAKMMGERRTDDKICPGRCRSSEDVGCFKADVHLRRRGLYSRRC